MQHGVIDPGDQIVVDLLLGQFERRVKDGSHDGQGLGGDQWLAEDVCGEAAVFRGGTGDTGVSPLGKCQLGGPPMSTCGMS